MLRGRVDGVLFWLSVAVLGRVAGDFVRGVRVFLAHGRFAIASRERGGALLQNLSTQKNLFIPSGDAEQLSWLRAAAARER